MTDAGAFMGGGGDGGHDPAPQEVVEDASVDPDPEPVDDVERVEVEEFGPGGPWFACPACDEDNVATDTGGCWSCGVEYGVVVEVETGVDEADEEQPDDGLAACPSCSARHSWGTFAEFNGCPACGTSLWELHDLADEDGDE